MTHGNKVNKEKKIKQDKMSDNRTKGYASQEPTSFKGGTKDIENDIYYYGKGMQQKCLTSSKKFLSYSGKKYGGCKWCH